MITASIQGYIGLIAIIGATALGCYLFYLAYQWVKLANQAIRERRQMRYRGEVGRDLLRIELELYNIGEPKRIAFDSWNARVELKKADIHDNVQYDAIENLSSAINVRNNYVNKKGIFRGDQDAEFLRLNNICVARFEDIKKAGFFDVEPFSFADTELKKEQMRLDAEVKKHEIWTRSMESLKQPPGKWSPVAIGARELTERAFRRERMKVYDQIIASLESEENRKQLKTCEDVLKFIREKQVKDLRG
jgi:hypothetical protein